MSVRVVARIRPLLNEELERDVIVHADRKEGSQKANIVKIPNPKNEAEEFSFAFNGVYDQETTQEDLFTAEVSPHLKALFQGLDVTIFAYGVTGTGKTHTMRGGLKLADRGVIPRLLSNVFRRGKKITKDSDGETTVDVALSYYEIYNDKVFDLMEPAEKRTPSGLPLREANGKTNVVGLSERACRDLKDFEALYIEANTNRVTAATKLNAHSSRSHAILRVKVTQTTGDRVLESTASAIDLAGSEDNRRTENNRERLVESAAINKSLFVLSQCVEAISRGDKRIPYRESKMTRILSLGQNNGITVMILNLAPMRSYHLDTLSSLNVSSRAKRIEVREIENEIVFKQAPRAMTLSGTSIQRQPLRPLNNAHNVHTGTTAANKEKAAEKDKDKPAKLFSVYSDKSKTAPARPSTTNISLQARVSNISKRKSDTNDAQSRPTKILRPNSVTSRPPLAAVAQPSITMSAVQIEEMVERKVQEILASRAAKDSQLKKEEQAPPPPQPASADISEAVQRRLEALERRIEDNDGGNMGRSEGMRLLLQARKLKEKGDDDGALRCYESALAYFPGQAKLLGKIERLRAKMAGKNAAAGPEPVPSKKIRKHYKTESDEDANDSDYNASEADADESYVDTKMKSSGSKASKARTAGSRPYLPTPESSFENRPSAANPPSPRTQRLLDIVNSHDADLIKGLHGFGPKKARDVVERLEAYEGGMIVSVEQLRSVPGFGGKTLERAWEGIKC
ncbi:kinesin-domain-containing protein [Cryphonectria parasitica EP155]|uniref:Kinesin-domain-containing protein n=1 Tax=Cryphonectria parasitica (strain ATCC 38755 / EP155) TaxID=660469 RepID=A0A9P4XYU1_CRYP1|nr:kinesin-domain-containing protein [Cryphonectria parasitica EP155]KAF3763285.1 kinesin-domain-containing protein [Cryphonectria parasitica EP155]